MTVEYAGQAAFSENLGEYIVVESTSSVGAAEGAMASSNTRARSSSRKQLSLSTSTLGYEGMALCRFNVRRWTVPEELKLDQSTRDLADQPVDVGASHERAPASDSFFFPRMIISKKN